MLPEVVLILVGVIPNDIAIHTQFACRVLFVSRSAQYDMGVDFGMTPLEVFPIQVGATPPEIAKMTEIGEFVLVSAMSQNLLSPTVFGPAKIARIWTRAANG